MSAIVRGAEVVAEAAASSGKAVGSTAGKAIQKGAENALKTLDTGAKNAEKQLGKVLPRSAPKKATKPKPKTTKFYLATRTRPPVNRKH